MHRSESNASGQPRAPGKHHKLFVERRQRADWFRRAWDIRRKLKFIVIDWSLQRC
jgi:hypothetical protein